ncbi:hypothetical protein TNCV_2336301 [Trichonephila clavipes]|uniref:Uncharacterized protein n=1 Tax=Trichonephila clavipes TaxID=2585209 RepID=A0A8X6SJJ1_TRICX|nr:hypothetical protein TNCV_2336301 [Trichonephila clavipes]
MYSAFATLGTINSHRAGNPLVEERWEALHPGYSPSKLGWNRAKTYCHLMVLKATANDRRSSSPLPR